MVATRKMEAILEAFEKRLDERMDGERRMQSAIVQEAIAELWKKMDERLSQLESSNGDRDSPRGSERATRGGSDSRGEQEGTSGQR